MLKDGMLLYHGSFACYQSANAGSFEESVLFPNGESSKMS